jgi:hypothetical protein
MSWKTNAARNSHMVLARCAALAPVDKQGSPSGKAEVTS